MADLVPNNESPDRCAYCGGPLDQRTYFCLRCAKPFKHPDSLLPASLPKYEDTETRLRENAGPAWTVFFVYLSVILISTMLAFGIWGEDQIEPAMIFVDLALVATTVIFLFRYWSDLRVMLKVVPVLHPATWLGLLLLVPVLLLNYGYHNFFTDLLGLEPDDYEDYFTSSWGPILFICISPAIIEEIGFRGIIQHQFEKAVSPWTAIVVASLAFSAAHFTILSAPYLALVGVLLGWLKWKTGSLYPSMLVHFIHNYVVVTVF